MRREAAGRSTDLAWLSLQLLINGLATGMLYALIALGFAIIYNGTRLLHLAHGAVFAFGGYAFYAARVQFELPVWAAGALCVLAASLLGVTMELLVYRPLRRKRSGEAPIIIASLGMLTLCQAMLGIFFGTDTLNVEHSTLGTYEVAGLLITQLHVAIAVIAAVIFPILQLVLTRTGYGRAIRALADNPELSVVFGVNVDRIYLVIFAIGSGLAAVAASLISYDTGVRPEMGFSVIFIAIVAVIAGGIGSLPGAALGGLIVGVLQSMSLLPLSARWQDAVVFGLLVVLLLLRPQGLFGHALNVRKA